MALCVRIDGNKQLNAREAQKKNLSGDLIIHGGGTNFFLDGWRQTLMGVWSPPSHPMLGSPARQTPIDYYKSHANSPSRPPLHANICGDSLVAVLDVCHIVLVIFCANTHKTSDTLQGNIGQGNTGHRNTGLGNTELEISGLRNTGQRYAGLSPAYLCPSH